jgi:hypothetical protein
MAVFLSPVGGVAAQFFTNTGAVLTGGKLYTYAAGTTTPTVTYTSSGGGVPWTNPIVLDAAGRVPSGGEIWLGDGIQYKFVLKDANDVLIATYDNISGINSNFTNFLANQEIQTATSGQTVFTLANPYVPGANTLSVFVDGVNQYGPGAQYAYYETNSNTVTFVSGLHVGASVKFTTVQSLTSTQATTAALVSYNQGGTGAVAYTVQDKLRQTVSVKDFGAVGNGTTDDTSAIQAALNAGAGGNVLLPQGQYKITSSLVVAAGTRVTGLSGAGGASGATCRILNFGTTAAIKGTGSYIYGVVLEDFVIDSYDGVSTVAAPGVDWTKIIYSKAINVSVRMHSIGFNCVDFGVINFYSCHVWNCTTGYYIDANVITIDGGSVNQCTTGVNVFQGVGSTIDKLSTEANTTHIKIGDNASSVLQTTLTGVVMEDPSPTTVGVKIGANANQTSIFGGGTYFVGGGTALTNNGVDTSYVNWGPNSDINYWIDGDWTPAITGDGGGNPTITYTKQDGKWKKFGDLLYLEFTIAYSAKSSGSTNYAIIQLPKEIVWNFHLSVSTSFNPGTTSNFAYLGYPNSATLHDNKLYIYNSSNAQIATSALPSGASQLSMKAVFRLY